METPLIIILKTLFMHCLTKQIRCHEDIKLLRTLNRKVRLKRQKDIERTVKINIELDYTL